jgi:NADPH:quinone reductase-like Zn-dependent oxidoreductase
MQAAVLHTLGTRPHFEEFPEPKAKDGEALINVRATALKPVDRQMANGSHYASLRELPAVCGIDGVGQLDSGERVFFAAPSPPYGSMAQRTVVHRARCWPVPDNVDDATAAAVVNPGMSAWLSLAWRAKLVAGEAVLVLGATGVTGRLAVQIAKQLGAGRVVAAGRNEQSLKMLRELGADATICLGGSRQELVQAFIQAAGETGFNVVLDYLWGEYTEALIAAITRADFGAARSTRTRLIQVGESAAPTITLPAAALRSSALEILGAGSGAVPPMDLIRDVYDRLLARVAERRLSINTERVPLAQVAETWDRPTRSGLRIVLIP